MITDRGKSYDAAELAQVAQQKCLAHLLRNVSKVIEHKTGMARQFGLKLKVLLREGLTLWHARGTLDGAEFELQRQQLDREMTEHLRDRILKDDDNQTLLNGIGSHHEAWESAAISHHRRSRAVQQPGVSQVLLTLFARKSSASAR